MCEVRLRSKMPTRGRLKTPGTGRTVGCGAGARGTTGDGRGVLEVPVAVDGPSTRRRSAPVRTSRCFWLQAGTIGGSARRLAPIGTPTPTSQQFRSQSFYIILYPTVMEHPEFWE